MESSNHAVFSAAVAHPRAMPDASAQAEAAVDEVALGAARISARLDRLPATRTIWQLVMLLSLGLFFELFDLMF